MPDKNMLLIAGMHRSGTSALCAVLERCGARFGSNLLNPMAGVNDEGFWEDAAVVELNQALLKRLGGTWFAPPVDLGQVDWESDTFEDLRRAAREIVARGSGSGALQAIKDPRLCLTLPLWLAACEEQGVPASICVMARAPLEVARSLQKRDGFPVGYGLRLCASYRRQLAATVPEGALYVTYDELLRDPVAVVTGLARSLPLQLPEEGLEGSVNPELRHHGRQEGDPLLREADGRGVDLAGFEAAIERDYPMDATVSELAGCLVERGEQLTLLGEDHARALDTLRQRDEDIEGLSALHREALATIDERDAQIVEFDRRLAETGAHLERALERLREMQRLLSIPVLGHLLRAMKWVYERR